MRHCPSGRLFENCTVPMLLLKSRRASGLKANGLAILPRDRDEVRIFIFKGLEDRLRWSPHSVQIRIVVGWNVWFLR